MTPEALTAIRSYLKEFKAYPTGENEEEFKSQAAIVNLIIPAIVDKITDDEIEVMMHQTFSFVLTSILNSQKEEMKPDVPTAADIIVNP